MLRVCVPATVVRVSQLPAWMTSPEAAAAGVQAAAQRTARATGFFKSFHPGGDAVGAA